MKIAVSNFEYGKMFQTNLNKSSYQAKIAAQSGCDIMIFHEWFLGINPVGTVPNKVTEQLSYIAQSNNIILISGNIRYMDESGAIKAGAFIFDKTGQIISVQPKVKLYEDEKRWISAGSEIEVTKTPLGNIAVFSGFDGMDMEFVYSSLDKMAENPDLIVLQCTDFNEEGAAAIRQTGIEVSKKLGCKVVIAGIRGLFYEKRCMGESVIIEDGSIKFKADEGDEVLLGFKSEREVQNKIIVDGHVHIVFRDPGEVVVDTKVERLVEKSIDIPTKQAILNFMNRANIDKSVIFDWSGALEDDYISSNEKVAELSRYSDRFIGFGVPSFKDPRFVDSVVDMGLKGLKFNPSLQGFYPDDEDFLKVCGRAYEHRLPMLIHTGPESAGKLKYDMPVYLDDIAVEYPNLSIIIAHIGVRGFTSEQAIMVAEKNSNVYVETSWASEDLLKDAIRKIGPDNVIFGSDFPSRNPITELEKINNLLKSNFIGKEDYYKIVGGNILRLIH